MPVFDPDDVPESNATSYPEPFRAANLHRYNRRLGDHAGLQSYGVVMTRSCPAGSRPIDMRIHGKMSSSTCSTARSRLKPMPVSRFFRQECAPDFRLALETAIASSTTRPLTPYYWLSVSPPNDEVSYPDIDMHLQPLPDGTRRFTRKDGTPY
jgi:uncharacterized cupin superfamily protein